MDWSLYVHIPFCRRKCFYCDFVSWAGQEELMPSYAAALRKELTARLPPVPPTTVYIGGGTPTALPLKILAELFADLRQKLAFPATGEFTLEANPGTVTRESLKELRRQGANRLSLGVQTFNDALLTKLGRIHTAAEAKEAFLAARTAGFDNVNLDLMYGLPGETWEDLQRDLACALDLAPEHISLYGLTVEPGTPFAAWAAQGKLPLPHEDEIDAMYDFLTEELPAAGFYRYEIANFAKPGCESRHNLGYWQDRPYLGLGVGAHSYWHEERLMNTADLPTYLENPTVLPQIEGERTLAAARGEYCFLALRTTQGLDKAKFAAKFGSPIEEFYGEAIAREKGRGLLEEANGHLRLTSLGMKYGNWVFSEFV